MDTILASLTTSISNFKTSPSAAIKKAGKRPFAVLVNNKPSFYVISPELYETLTELLFDIQSEPVIKKRLGRLQKAISVDPKDL
jgi:antitoxin StbD